MNNQLTVEEENNKNKLKAEIIKNKYSVSKITKNKLSLNYSNNILIVTQNNEQLFECAICHKQYKSAIAARAHMIIHDSGMKKCPYCDRRFKNKQKYKKHILNKHINMPDYLEYINNIDSLFLETYKYNNIQEIINDIENNCINNDIDNIMQTSYWGDSVIYNQDTQLYKCSICNRTFKNVPSIKSHMIVHSKKIYRCPICGTKTKSEISFKNHVYLHQSNLYKCQYCNDVFTSLEDLRMHLCKHAIYNITDNDYFIDHKELHMQKGFICNHCGVEFVNRSDYYNHIIAIQNLITDNPINHFHLEIDDKYENQYYIKCMICNNKFFDIKTHIENYHHIDYNEYLLKWNIQDYSMNIINNPAYLQPRNRIFFNLVANDKAKPTTSIISRRNEMNNFERQIKMMLPDNVLFADTKFYVAIHRNRIKTRRNPDFIVVPNEWLDAINIDIMINGYVCNPELYKKINKVIECFGMYWHSDKFTGLSNAQHEQQVKIEYAKAGINCLVIWETDLNDKIKLQNKIDYFLNAKNI